MPIRLEDLAASFRRDLTAERRSKRTITIYGQALRSYCDWLAAHDRPATLDELTRPAIREWLASLNTRGLQASTVATRFRGMRRFCRWLTAEGELPADPMAGMAVPVATERPVPVLSDAQLGALLKACAGKGFLARRDEALLRMLLDTGVRVSELVAMTVAAVELDRGATLVRGKGDKVRAVYFGARTTRALDRYLRERRQHRWAHLPELFLSQRGAMSSDGVRERLNVLGAQAGVTGMHPHRLRHTFAHDFLLNGGQERDLKRLAGWSSDVMLERYGSSAADERARTAARRMARGDRV